VTHLFCLLIASFPSAVTVAARHERRNNSGKVHASKGSEKSCEFVIIGFFPFISMPITCRWHRIGTERPAEDLISLFGCKRVFIIKQMRISIRFVGDRTCAIMVGSPSLNSQVR
jgi:hypothetical protein